MVGWNHSVVLYCFRKIVSELVVGSTEQLSLSVLYTKEMASGSIDWRDTWVCKSIELTGLDHYLGATVVTQVAPAVKSLGWVMIEPDVIRQCSMYSSHFFFIDYGTLIGWSHLFWNYVYNFVSVLVSSSAEQSTSFSQYLVLLMTRILPERWWNQYLSQTAWLD